MALIQSTRAPGGGGGGGNQISGWATESFVQTTNFTANSVVLTLAHTPLFPAAVCLQYNGDLQTFGTHFSIVANQITILFGDPYVTDYDENPVFVATYPF